MGHRLLTETSQYTRLMGLRSRTLPLLPQAMQGESCVCTASALQGESFNQYPPLCSQKLPTESNAPSTHNVIACVCYTTLAAVLHMKDRCVRIQPAAC